LERLSGTNSSVRFALGRAEQLGNFRIAPEDYEPVARALSDHLSRSGEYSYTLKLRRVDPASDPVEEFLIRSKVGHCQRFAAGLVLMLRSVGIPANYVLGFKGCEPEGDGEYTVRQDRAHAWAEVLVVRPTPPGFSVQRPPGDDGAMVCHWLSLDPSPDGGAEDSGVALTGWLGSARQTGAAFFQNFIVGYNRDRREATVATARDWLIRGGWVVVGLLAIVAGVLIARPTVRRRPKRYATASSATGWEWYDRMTSALTEGGHEVPPGSTPREFAEAVRAALSGRPETAAVADVPRTITGAFYRARYGGLSPDDAEFARMAADIDRLQSSLRTAPRATPRSPESPL
jgi:hypothetical protein